jgi:hypothetical protein
MVMSPGGRRASLESAARGRGTLILGYASALALTAAALGQVLWKSDTELFHA